MKEKIIPTQTVPEGLQLEDRRNTPVGIGSTQEQFSIPDQVEIIGSALKDFVRQATLFVAKKIQ